MLAHVAPSDLIPPPPVAFRDAWRWSVGSGRAHVRAMCVLLQRGWFIRQELWCVTGDCSYGDHGPFGAGPDTEITVGWK